MLLIGSATSTQPMQVIDPSACITVPSDAEPEDIPGQAGPSNPTDATEGGAPAKSKPGRPRAEWPEDLTHVLATWLLQNPSLKMGDAPQVDDDLSVP